MLVGYETRIIIIDIYFVVHGLVTKTGQFTRSENMQHHTEEVKGLEATVSKSSGARDIPF